MSKCPTSRSHSIILTVHYSSHHRQHTYIIEMDFRCNALFCFVYMRVQFQLCWGNFWSEISGRRVSHKFTVSSVIRMSNTLVVRWMIICISWWQTFLIYFIPVISHVSLNKNTSNEIWVALKATGKCFKTSNEMIEKRQMVIRFESEMWSVCE